MTKKKVTVSAAITAFVVLLLLPVGYYCFFALVRHEHFYKGLPTSYWARAVKRWDPPVSLEIPDIARGEKAAIPVLLQLIWNADEDVSSRACVVLARTIPEMKERMRGSAYVGTADELDNRVILCLSNTSYKTNTLLILIDKTGGYLDDLNCSAISHRLESTGRLVRGLEPNGQEFAIRYVLDGVAGYGARQPGTVSLPGGDIIVDRSNSLEIYGRDFGDEAYTNGLLRLTVRDDKFKVVWPKLELRGDHGLYSVSTRGRFVDPRLLRR
jgi:hypothetical protein